MKHTHYFQSDLFIASDTENVRFERYIENNNKRFLQYIEGTLEEILPEDFEDGQTELPDGTLYCGSGSLKRITFPDIVTTIGVSSSETTTLFINTTQETLEIFFPANLKVINGNVLNASSNALRCICDFSKTTSVPVINNTNGDAFSGADEIRVPSSLYSTWITTTGWSNLSTNIFIAV